MSKVDIRDNYIVYVEGSVVFGGLISANDQPNAWMIQSLGSSSLLGKSDE